MKKIHTVYIIISIGLFMLFIGIFNDNKNEYLHHGFIQWQNGEFTESEGHDFFREFQQDLSNNPTISNEDIWNISKTLNILEYNGLRVMDMTINFLMKQD